MHKLTAVKKLPAQRNGELSKARPFAAPLQKFATPEHCKPLAEPIAPSLPSAKSLKPSFFKIYILIAEGNFPKSESGEDDFGRNEANELSDFYAKKKAKNIELFFYGCCFPLLSPSMRRKIKAQMPSHGMDHFRCIASEVSRRRYVEFQTALFAGLSFLNAEMKRVDKGKFFDVVLSSGRLNDVISQLSKAVETKELASGGKKIDKRAGRMMERHSGLAELAYGKMTFMKLAYEIHDGALSIFKNKMYDFGKVSADVVCRLANVKEKTPEGFMRAVEKLLPLNKKEIREKARGVLDCEFKRRYRKTFEEAAGKEFFELHFILKHDNFLLDSNFNRIEAKEEQF